MVEKRLITCFLEIILSIGRKKARAVARPNPVRNSSLLLAAIIHSETPPDEILFATLAVRTYTWIVLN